MWHSISFRTRIYGILSALLFITLMGGLILVWYTYQMEGLLASLTQKNLAGFQTAEALETALINQKGFVSYYFMDGNPDWLRQLGEYRQIFKERLKQARDQAESQPERAILDKIKTEYGQYIEKKDLVIELYKSGQRERGAELHSEVRPHFFEALNLCESYKDLHRELIAKALKNSHLQATRLRVAAVAAMSTAFFLAVFLVVVLGRQILDPVRRLTAEARRKSNLGQTEDEVKALSRSVHELIEDVDHTQSELQRSRESLLQAEKLALVGKLSAGMAHSIRNPFTSVKMRLFSLSRSLKLSETQKEDFDVISEEIRHIDTIVQNFLEFSRPPKLKMQRISPSAVVDLAMQLLEHRLKSYNVAVSVERIDPLPEIQADPEQLKEVLVNLIVNACEAMEKGGKIVITENGATSPSGGETVEIRVCDNGPGIPESIQEKVWQPFFTTKEEGTGLGLSIAARIIEDHQGRIDIESKEGEGTTFIIKIPVKETGHEHSDH
jgi:signal transduction histidine kinase